MKKILIYSTAYLPFIGGAELAVKEITDRLPDFEFDLITSRLDASLPEEEKIGNVNVFRIGNGSGFDKFILPFAGAIKGYKLNRQKGYDAIWSIMASQASIAAAFLKIVTKRPQLVLTLQEGDEEDHLKRYVGGNKLLYKILIKPWHRLVFRRADRITAISEYLKQRAIKSGVKGEVHVVPNGVDCERYREVRQFADRAALRKEFGIEFGGKLVITTSRLVEKNGVGTLIAAMAEPELLEETDVKLLVVGSGQLEDVLKKQIVELGLEGRVIMAGRVVPERIPEYLAAADIFARPSLSEGMGNSFVEAMAAGLPVVATPVGGIVDFVFDPERNPDKESTGLFTAPGDPKMLAKQIARLVDDDDLQSRLVGNARRLVSEKYDWNSIAEKMRGII